MKTDRGMNNFLSFIEFDHGNMMGTVFPIKQKVPANT